VRTIILIAKNNGWLHADPFANYKFHTEKTERAFLTEKELERIMQKEFDVKRLEQVRDIFNSVPTSRIPIVAGQWQVVFQAAHNFVSCSKPLAPCPSFGQGRISRRSCEIKEITKAAQPAKATPFLLFCP
jgi:glycerol-3-phosphate dehydrogenase